MDAAYHPTVVHEAKLEQTDAGLVPASTGWFVMNARDARWFHRPGRDSLPLTGSDEFEAETYFPMLGMSIQVLPGGGSRCQATVRSRSRAARVS